MTIFMRRSLYVFIVQATGLVGIHKTYEHSGSGCVLATKTNGKKS